MATSFTKVYSIEVTFSRDDGGAITDADIQATELRNEIKKEISQVCSRTKGIYHTVPGTVSES